MSFEFIKNNEKSISIIANLTAVITAIAGVFSFFLSSSPWFVAIIAFIGLVITLIALTELKSRFRELEKQAMSVAKSYLEFSLFTYKDSLQDRNITFSEIGYLTAIMKDICHQTGQDTSEIDAFIEKVMLIEIQTKSKK